MSTRKLIPLSMWAARRYEKPPSTKTLYRWVKAGKIAPFPTKDGGTYYVQPNATVVDPNAPDYYEILARAHESAQTQ